MSFRCSYGERGERSHRLTGPLRQLRFHHHTGVLAIWLFSLFALRPTAAIGAFTSSNLPIIIIDTGGKTIPDLVRIRATMKIIYNGPGQRNNLSDSPNNYNGLIDIELRGSSSIAYPKKGYRLETVDAFGDNNNVSLLGLPKENDWILYASYDDQSLMRNALAYRLSLEMGRYAPRLRFCELMLNGDYHGVYQLVEKVKQDKNRVNIAELKNTDKTGDGVTGGYLFKFDKTEGEETAGWTSRSGLYYQYDDPNGEDLAPEQKSYLKGFMDVFESAMSRPVPSDSTAGYPRYIDVRSFVDHFLLTEFCKNVDGYRISSFMFKDRDSRGGKLNAGPIWDFNLTFGKAWYSEDNGRVDEWEVDHNQYKPMDWPKVPFWWERLSHDPHFVSLVRIRWAELSQGLFKAEAMDRRIDLLADTLAEARVRDAVRWPESSLQHSYTAELNLMKQWIRNRTSWMNANFYRLASVDNDRGGAAVTTLMLSQNYPNPFNQGTMLSFWLPQAAEVSLRIYSAAGREVAVLQQGLLPSGQHTITWNAAGAPSGLYLCRLESAGQVQSRKLLLVR